MPNATTNEVVDQLLAVLREAFEGPPESWSYFTDNDPAAGLFGTLAPLSASDASRLHGGTSIAAHVHHILFSLEVSTAWLSGDRSRRNWQESWSVSEVDDAAWARMLEQLRSGYAELRQAFETHAGSDAETVGGAIAAVAHVAYHLGAIRQKLVFSRVR
jgi:hypothetical protein